VARLEHRADPSHQVCARELPPKPNIKSKTTKTDLIPLAHFFGVRLIRTADILVAHRPRGLRALDAERPTDNDATRGRHNAFEHGHSRTLVEPVQSASYVHDVEALGHREFLNPSTKEANRKSRGSRSGQGSVDHGRFRVETRAVSDVGSKPDGK
jgi:hypothetical protein